MWKTQIIKKKLKNQRLKTQKGTKLKLKLKEEIEKTLKCNKSNAQILTTTKNQIWKELIFKHFKKNVGNNNLTPQPEFLKTAAMQPQDCAECQSIYLGLKTFIQQSRAFCWTEGQDGWFMDCCRLLLAAVCSLGMLYNWTTIETILLEQEKLYIFKWLFFFFFLSELLKFIYFALFKY